MNDLSRFCERYFSLIVLLFIRWCLTRVVFYRFRAPFQLRNFVQREVGSELGTWLPSFT